jgi:hypothetical protein
MQPSFDDLTPEERALRYREMAEHTQSLAEKVKNPHLREAYIELSGRWRALAESTQRAFSIDDRSFDPPDKG